MTLSEHQVKAIAKMTPCRHESRRRDSRWDHRMNNVCRRHRVACLLMTFSPWLLLLLMVSYIRTAGIAPNGGWWMFLFFYPTTDSPSNQNNAASYSPNSKATTQRYLQRRIFLKNMEVQLVSRHAHGVTDVSFVLSVLSDWVEDSFQNDLSSAGYDTDNNYASLQGADISLLKPFDVAGGMAEGTALSLPFGVALVFADTNSTTAAVPLPKLLEFQSSMVERGEFLLLHLLESDTSGLGTDLQEVSISLLEEEDSPISAELYQEAPESSAPPVSTSTLQPSILPIETQAPTLAPISSGTDAPSAAASQSPTRPVLPSSPPSLSMSPSTKPTSHPTSSSMPTDIASQSPTDSPAPSAPPTSFPTVVPTITSRPTISDSPSSLPSSVPSDAPSASMVPSTMPSQYPSDTPTAVPSFRPSFVPTTSPAPSAFPSSVPSDMPSVSLMPSSAPSISHQPTASFPPSSMPSSAPSESFLPSLLPSTPPSTSPPSSSPSPPPSFWPSQIPSSVPSMQPTLYLDMNLTEANIVMTLAGVEENMTVPHIKAWERETSLFVQDFWNSDVLTSSPVHVLFVETTLRREERRPSRTPHSPTGDDSFSESQEQPVIPALYVLSYSQKIGVGYYDEMFDTQLGNMNETLFLLPFQVNSFAYTNNLMVALNNSRQIYWLGSSIEKDVTPQDKDSRDQKIIIIVVVVVATSLIAAAGYIVYLLKKEDQEAEQQQLAPVPVIDTNFMATAVEDPESMLLKGMPSQEYPHHIRSSSSPGVVPVIQPMHFRSPSEPSDLSGAKYIVGQGSEHESIGIESLSGMVIQSPAIPVGSSSNHTNEGGDGAGLASPSSAMGGTAAGMSTIASGTHSDDDDSVDSSELEVDPDHPFTPHMSGFQMEVQDLED